MTENLEWSQFSSVRTEGPIEMEYILAAAILEKLNQEVNEDNISNIIKSTGVTPNKAQVEMLVKAIAGRDALEKLDELKKKFLISSRYSMRSSNIQKWR